MDRTMAAILGGLAAGVVTTALMQAGRRSGVLGKTLDRDAVDWIDRTTGSRAVIGDTGTSVVEFVNHLAASAAFGAAYEGLRQATPRMDPLSRGVLYGTALYAVNIGMVAPILGITEGEVEAGPRKAAERWGAHAVQGAVTAVLAETLSGGARSD
ncbi:hypothetical protein [Paracoccus sp. (in: a-proteobacteria)]|uniref:hypothetical protein n=1 Tax=Paracoccus sp. TaxID=267 RepID=UPI0035B343DC